MYIIFFLKLCLFLIRIKNKVINLDFLKNYHCWCLAMMNPFFFLAITCDRPTLQYPLHISANSNRSSYNYNNSIEFTCSLGYTIQNSSVKYCTHTDAFQRNLPSCKGMQIHAETLGYNASYSQALGFPAKSHNYHTRQTCWLILSCTVKIHSFFIF